MPPPKTWGPPIWTLFHVLAEKINEEAYPHIYKQLFNQIQKICRYLPCPECSHDATNFLAKVRLTNIKTKYDFKMLFYMFHNFVNKKTRKPAFNIKYIDVYKKYNIISVINNFLIVYNTHGNMKLLMETFQRQFVIKEFNFWIKSNIRAFFSTIVPPEINTPLIKEHENIKLDITEEEPLKEEPVVEEPVVEEPVVEEPLKEEPVVEEPVVEDSNNADVIMSLINTPQNITHVSPIGGNSQTTPNAVECALYLCNILKNQQQEQSFGVLPTDIYNENL